PAGTPTGRASLSPLVGTVNAELVGIFNAGQQHVRDRAVLQEAFRVVLNDSPEFLTSRGWRWDELSPVGSQDELTAPPTL
ncbi:hypothetical protein, partial [Streptomyces sp. NPDC058656]|uniref:hypothetical protein n=1 Tax=Streptomyces sp. NPDC058656 TaxID=3346578 RepID=UPI0036647EC8